ncbi:MAG: TRAP transporter small permease [Thermodesulfobacteriota bacterium]
MATEKIRGGFRSLVRAADLVMKTAIVAAMAAILLVICLQIFFRFVLNNSLAWPEELARFTMIWSSLLAAVYVQLERGHLRVNFFVDKLPRKVAFTLGLLTDLLVIGFLVAAVMAGIQESYVLMDLKTGALRISRSIPYLAVPVSAALLALATAILIVKDIMEFKRK